MCILLAPCLRRLGPRKSHPACLSSSHSPPLWKKDHDYLTKAGWVRWVTSDNHFFLKQKIVVSTVYNQVWTLTLDSLYSQINCTWKCLPSTTLHQPSCCHPHWRQKMPWLWFWKAWKVGLSKKSIGGGVTNTVGHPIKTYPGGKDGFLV